jgi:putative ABC transport system ATP-binding protein
VDKLRADHLTRTVDDKRIVDDVTIAVSAGELIAIVGSSGSGKSSFLRLLNRLDEPTGGSVFIDGVDYRTIDPRDLRRRVGMLMQQAFLFPGTVASNVRFGPAQRGEKLSEDEVEGLLERVGLTGFAARTVDNLSGGEAQRVSLARTLANRPDIVLMDEPTSALDETLKRQVEDVIVDVMRRQRLTCLLATHDAAQAARIANRVMALDSGRLRALGSPQEVLHAHPAH